MDFKKEHPDIRFILQQGEYTSIARWVEEGLSLIHICRTCPLHMIYTTKLLYHFHEYIRRLMKEEQELSVEELQRGRFT